MSTIALNYSGQSGDLDLTGHRLNITRGETAIEHFADVAAQLREAHKRIKLLEQEAEVMRRAVGCLSWDANPK